MHGVLHGTGSGTQLVRDRCALDSCDACTGPRFAQALKLKVWFYIRCARHVRSMLMCQLRAEINSHVCEYMATIYPVIIVIRASIHWRANRQFGIFQSSC